MRTLPPELLTEYTKEISCRKHLFVFEWSTTYRWTDCAENIYYGGNWYESKKINFDSIALSMNAKIDSTTIQIDDVDRKLQKVFLSERIADKPAWIYEVALDKNLQPLGAAAVQFMGYCDTAARQIGKREWEIPIYNHMIKWRRYVPRRETSPTCQWKFKHTADKLLGTDSQTYTCILPHMGHTSNRPITGGSWSTYWTLSGSGGLAWTQWNWYLPGTCRYAGAETWCDGTIDRCIVLANRVNFGGFQWIPWNKERKIWWGQLADPTRRALYDYSHRKG